MPLCVRHCACAHREHLQRRWQLDEAVLRRRRAVAVVRVDEDRADEGVHRRQQRGRRVARGLARGAGHASPMAARWARVAINHRGGHTVGAGDVTIVEPGVICAVNCLYLHTHASWVRLQLTLSRVTPPGATIPDARGTCVCVTQAVRV